MAFTLHTARRHSVMGWQCRPNVTQETQQVSSNAANDSDGIDACRQPTELWPCACSKTLLQTTEKCGEKGGPAENKWRAHRLGDWGKTVALELVCGWCRATVCASDWACIKLSPQRSTHHGNCWYELAAGGRAPQCSTCAARACRKREDAHRRVAGDFEEQQKEISVMWVWPLHTFTASRNADPKRKNLRAWNPMLAHFPRKCSTHPTANEGATADGSLSRHVAVNSNRSPPRAESRRRTQVPAECTGLRCQTGRSTRPLCASPTWLGRPVLKKSVEIAWVEQEEYTLKCVTQKTSTSLVRSKNIEF